MAPELSHNYNCFSCFVELRQHAVIAGHSKKTMWQVFKDHHELLCGLEDDDITQDKFSAEAFVFPAFNVHTTNEARYMLFFLVKMIEAFPPTSDALKLHMMRDHYHSMVSMILKQANCSQPNPPSPTDSGWKFEDGRCITILMAFQPIPESCMELVSRQCKTGCQILRCTCRKSKVHCTQSCKCSNLVNNIPCMNITDYD